MKNILLTISCGALLLAASCKKEPDKATEYIVTPSSPTVTITGPLYYSIPVGGDIPAVSATAYDSILQESYPVQLDATTLDNTLPGLYVVSIRAKNRYGYQSSSNVFVAVTDVSPSVNLAGTYRRTSNNEAIHVTKVANGLYHTDDIGGVPAASDFDIPAVFVHINDTTIQVPNQYSEELGSNLYCSIDPNSSGDTRESTFCSLKMAPGDTTYSYIVFATGFAESLRTFKKR